MKFNLYKLSSDFEIVNTDNQNLDRLIQERIKIIETQITSEFLKEQKGKIGIKSLGNKLRYNQTLKKEFSKSKDNQIIVKLTENRRAFIKVFIDNWIENNTSEIYYFILESSFGTSSNIVDGSFIRINEIKEELSKFHDYFRKNTEGPKISFIEMKGFDNHHLIDNNGYTYLQPKK